MKSYLPILILVSSSVVICFGQIQNPPTPQYEEFKPIQLNGNTTYKASPTPNTSHQYTPKVTTAEDIIRQQNEQFKRILMPPAQSVKERQQQSLEIVQALLNEEKQGQKQSIPTKTATKEEESLYTTSTQKICNMLLKKEAVSIKKAVWLSEAPYLRGKSSYDSYKAQIDGMVEFCKLYAKEQKLDWSNHDNRAKTLVSFFSKTLVLANGQTHKRFMYDFEDPYGRQSYKPLMVTKLLSSNTGQCHSMPLLFKVLAEEIKIKAYICLSPSHSYIKIFLEDGRTPVFETTNGSLTKEDWLLATNIVPFTALRNGVYLDTLSEKETLIHCLTHLANAYESEFGYKQLVYDIAQIAVQETPKYPPAWALFSNYVTYTTMEALAKLNYPKLEELEEYPVLKGRLELMYQIYSDMDIMGLNYYTLFKTTPIFSWKSGANGSNLL